MSTVGESLQEIIEHTGEYIRFDGQGIMSGLKQPKLKNSFYKIIGFERGSAISCGGLTIKAYRSRNYSFLPIHCFNQGFEIIGIKEYNKLQSI